MNQIIMILLISMLVLVHEIGHFIAARLCGIRVTRFGIGMPIGPSCKLFKLKDTTFYIHAFLFGGYVSFADDEKNFKKDEKNKDNVEEEELLPSDSPELYENKTIAQKLFVVSAGVIMNIVFAVILVMACAVFYHKLPTAAQDIYVDNFAEKITSNIQDRGIHPGDKIIKVNSIEVKSLYQLTFFAKNSKLFDDYAQKDLIEKNLAELKKLNPSIAKGSIKEGTEIKLPQTMQENPLNVNKNILSGLEKYKKDGVALNKKQIELRDKIELLKETNKKAYCHINPNSFKDIDDITPDYISAALSDTYKPLSITVLRDGREVTIDDIKVNKEGVLGLMLKIQDVYEPVKTPRDVVVKSFDYIYTTTATMLFSLWQLFSGKVSASDMHGVIAVVKVGGDIIASKGLLNGLLLTAMISINLAMFLIIEKLTGKKPSQELADKITNFFFMLLIILMIAICYNDIFALITKKF